MNASIFPDESAIPAALRIEKPLEQREYLIAGELRQWRGELNPVVSPIFVQTAKGYEQKVVGHTPLLTPGEAMVALDAAVAAYDLGHGVWPRMTVTERIEHVERFIDRMKEKREAVVTLLM